MNTVRARGGLASIEKTAYARVIRIEDRLSPGDAFVLLTTRGSPGSAWSRALSRVLNSAHRDRDYPAVDDQARIGLAAPWRAFARSAADRRVGDAGDTDVPRNVPLQLAVLQSKSPQTLCGMARPAWSAASRKSDCLCPRAVRAEAMVDPVSANLSSPILPTIPPGIRAIPPSPSRDAPEFLRYT